MKKQKLEKYSERFDNDESAIGNPETWGRRLVKEEPDYTALLKPVGTWQENYLEEYFLDKMKEVLQFGNDAQAIRFMEKYFEAKQERSYSEEEVIAFGEFIFKHTLLSHAKGVKNLFEQFKKK